MSVPTSRRILGGERINDTDLWCAAKNSIEVDGLPRGCLEWRNQLQFPQKSLNVFGLLPLNGAYDHVLSPVVAPPGFIQHAIGFAHARRVAKKNLEFRAPALVLFRLHLL